MKKKHLLLLSLFSALLLSIPFYEWGSGIILFIALVPLLFIADHFVNTDVKRSGLKAIGFAALTFVVWNGATVYWIKNATLVGGIGAVFISAFFMTLAFSVFYFSANQIGMRRASFAFILYWIAYEMFFMNGELAWSWLMLGNGFANDVQLIQWYEITGVVGGTFWVLLVNALIFGLIKHFVVNKELKSKKIDILILSAIVVIPMVYSIYRYHTYEETGDLKKILILQPNIDPFTEKFNTSVDKQVDVLINLAYENLDSTFDYVVGPETVMDYLWLNNFEQSSNVKKIRELVAEYPNVNVVFGSTTLYRYAKGEKHSSTVRKFKGRDTYYDAYNSALQIDTTEGYQIYHKSKLVVGVEKMPYPKLMRFLDKIIINIGGTTGSRGVQDYRGVFKSSSDSTLIAPVICYESVFGEYLTDYIKNGANLVFVITNDGWWKDTPGYKQHLSYARLRAIETRKSIARSANTGISALINQRGDILQKTEWWVKDIIIGEIRANKTITPYVKNGDFIGRIGIFFSSLIFLMSVVIYIKKKSEQKN